MDTGNDKLRNSNGIEREEIHEDCVKRWAEGGGERPVAMGTACSLNKAAQGVRGSEGCGVSFGFHRPRCSVPRACLSFHRSRQRDRLRSLEMLERVPCPCRCGWHASLEMDGVGSTRSIRVHRGNPIYERQGNGRARPLGSSVRRPLRPPHRPFVFVYPRQPV